MIDKHIMKLRTRDDVGPDEEAALRQAVKDTIRAAPHDVVVRERQLLDVSMILVKGMAARQKDLPDGRRQFTQLHVPGDFTDLHSFTLKYLDHDVVALSPATFAVIPHGELQRITERFPHLTRILWFGTNVDAAIHREWELSLGSRSAVERMAHLFCELFVRLRVVELTRDHSYDLPISQQELGETLGITPVHANRTLQLLRNSGAVDFAKGMVRINDWPALQELAGFDPYYLYLERQPL